jgi:hypothetical protein
MARSAIPPAGCSSFGSGVLVVHSPLDHNFNTGDGPGQVASIEIPFESSDGARSPIRIA